MTTKEPTFWQDAHEGRLDKVKEWIEQKGKKIDDIDSDERTALHWAAINGNEQLIRYLLDSGAKFDTKDDSGWTPIMSAAASDKLTSIQLILSRGKVDLNQKNDTGRTALIYACSKAKDPETINILLKNGAKVNLTDAYGATPLHRAAANKSKSSLPIVQLLIENGANINAQDKEGTTPLHIACQEDNEGVAMAIVNAGADVEIKNELDRSPLDDCTQDLFERIVPVARKLHPKKDTNNVSDL
eukprot:TRINITY_DN933_c0_g1_i5.p1 TRINITY_DN933_c0_g1~~TRINITY_DN933_c0_g1_i5.p1  ORF type:complete len:259 (+),score=76.51 TRINITY_DN933_c0_g1_i5:49-777(+)